MKSSGHATHTAIHFKRNDPGSRRPSRRYASACTVMISLVVVIFLDFESQLKSSGHATHGMTLDPGAPGDSNWTFRLSPVVSAMLSGVVGACVAYMSSCVLLAPRCVSPSRFFFACGEMLGQSEVLIGPSVFLLSLKKKSYFTLSSGWAPDFWL